jgi:hypothetical protein
VGAILVELQIGTLRSICLRHPHVADQHAVTLTVDCVTGAKVPARHAAYVTYPILEMPGVDKSGLEVTVDNGELTIVRHSVPREIGFRKRHSVGISPACKRSSRLTESDYFFWLFRGSSAGFK